MNYISVKEAAAQWGVTIQMVRRYCQKGMIPQVIKENGGWRIPEGTEPEQSTDPSVPEETDPEDQPGKTGDVALSVLAGMLAVSAIGGAVVISKKKEI